MHNLAYLKKELSTIESFLKLHPLGSLQRTVREIEKVYLFHAIHYPEGKRVIEGFMWSPNADDIQYEIDLSGPGVPTVEIIIGSDNRAADIAKVVAEIPYLSDTSKVREAALGKTGGGGKGKKGYYLIVGVAKETAILNFENAPKSGIGSNDFADFCIPRNFQMIHYKGSTPIK